VLHCQGFVEEFEIAVIARGRGRYIDATFDLDLTYITERVIGIVNK
jgi:hypothetical protein